MPAALCLSREEIDHLVREDAPYGDLTTQALDIGGADASLRFAARNDMRVCGIEEAAAIFDSLGASITLLAASGSPVLAGTALLTARGSARQLFVGWKVAQTLVEWSSGVATAVARVVAAARESSAHVAVACTRKTVPFTRSLAVKAVRAGGGTMHRLGLSDSILLFPEHRKFLEQELREQITRLRRAAPERSIAIEVNSVEEALAAAAHVDVLQLEKLTPAQVAEVVRTVQRRADGRPLVAAAGGIHAGNAAQYAMSGADVLVTSWPYQGPPQDVQVTFCATG